MLPRAQTSLDENLRANEGGKENASPFIFLLLVVPCATSLVTRVSHAFRPSLCEKTKRLKRRQL